MFRRDVQHPVSRCAKRLARDCAGKRRGGSPLGKREFDRDLPNADRGDKDVVRLVANQLSGPLAQPLCVGQRPNRNLRVQQYPHSSPRKRRAIASFPASNSACENDGYCPLSSPNRLPACAGAPIGTSRAAGLPFRAMMISLVAPLSTSSTSRERWVLASSILTIDMEASLTKSD